MNDHRPNPFFVGLAIVVTAVVAMTGYARLDDRIAHLEHQVQVLEQQAPTSP